MRLFAKLTGGRMHGSRAFPSRVARASALPPVSFSSELRDAIDVAQVSPREPDEDGARVMVMCHSLCGAFIYSREEAARRIRLAFPELGDDGVARAVRHLESRVRLVSAPKHRGANRPSWVHGWMER